MYVKIYGGTDVGKVRKLNQDSLYFDAAKGLVLVADGIGGRKGGEIASAIAVNTIKAAFSNVENIRAEDVSNFLVSSIDRANHAIFERGKLEPDIRGLGTTLNCLYLVNGHVYVAHIGDSRSYLYYQGNLWQLTLDHSVEVYLQRGWLSRESVAPQAKPTALVRALGLSERCEVDIYEKQVKTGEIYLTCSDGLSGLVSNRHICALINAHILDLGKLPEVLINEAKNRGGHDNITVAISEVLNDHT